MAWFNKLFDSIPAQGSSRLVEIPGEDLSKYIPESFTVSELLASVQQAVEKTKLSKTKNTKETQKLLQAIITCLQQPDKIQATSDENQDSAAHTMALIISQLIAPIVPSTKNDDTKLNAAFNDDLTASIPRQTQHSLVVSHLGVQAISALTNLITSTTQLDTQVLLTLISFTTDPSSQKWTTPESALLASTILNTQFTTTTTNLKKEKFIHQQVLQQYLRPLFSKSKPASVTSSGRKAAYTDPNQEDGRGGIPDDTSLTKPWKFTDLRAVPVASWAVKEADDALISTTWPLYIPVLLTLVDDNSTPIRSTGLQILNSFLLKFPTQTLQSTGLNKVFEDAISPTLTYLPSLTPVDESVQLLNPAYEALLTLASKSSSSPNALLDKIIRQGIFEGHFHAKEHLRIVQVLNHWTQQILSQMGIHAVKHLKDIIPSLITTTLTDPFAPASPETLLSAIKTLQAVLTTCWPRIPAYRDEILNALVICWLNLPSDNPHLEIEKELITSSRLLSAVLDSADSSSSSPSPRLSQLVSPLIHKEPSLAKLFSLCLSPSPSPSAD